MGNNELFLEKAKQSFDSGKVVLQIGYTIVATIHHSCGNGLSQSDAIYIANRISELWNSHSPTISDLNDPANDNSMLIEFQHLEPDTLQEGDWFQGTEDQYRKLFEMENRPCIDSSVNVSVKWNHVCYGGSLLRWRFDFKKTQLTPEEFLRRAENTFKTKYDD